MPEIWIVQYLCPQRHAIAAAPYDPAETSATDIERYVHAEMSRFGVRHVCGICESNDLKFEHRKTRFTDWTTARRELFQSQTDQIRTREYLERIRLAKN